MKAIFFDNSKCYLEIWFLGYLNLLTWCTIEFPNSFQSFVSVPLYCIYAFFSRYNSTLIFLFSSEKLLQCLSPVTIENDEVDFPTEPNVNAKGNVNENRFFFFSFLSNIEYVRIEKKKNIIFFVTFCKFNDFYLILYFRRNKNNGVQSDRKDICFVSIHRRRIKINVLVSEETFVLHIF